VWLVEMPVVLPLAAAVERAGFGLVPRLALPRPLGAILALLLMDYTLYVWHVLTHRVPFLWRVHLVHHVDRDLDASTALRFHAAEIAVSVPWRAAQVALIGLGPAELVAWQALTLTSVLFHHANVRLTPAVERALGWVVMTPRLHGIHHSVVREETDSNWSSGLTLWDRLHGTLRADVLQSAVTIGVPAYRDAEDVRLARVLLLPFRAQRPSWRWPDGRPSITRAPSAVSG
jgi:sterol desaturase/sphingolipid hydroxylase (fatty acid hydroxylase superfamily)